MKRLAICLILIPMCFAPVFGNQRIYLGLEVGYFHPQAQDFLDVYGGGIQLGSELSMDIWKGFTAWLGGRYLRRTSQLSLTKEDITLQLIPIYLGGGYQFLSSGRWHPFIGGGVSLNLFSEKASLETIKQSKFGLWGQAGVSVRIMKSIALEAKCIYNHCRMEFTDAEVDVSGISGILGIKFLLKD